MHTIEKLLNAIAADLMLAAVDDLAPLARMLDGFEKIAVQPGVPGALATQAKRSIDLINNIIMRETAFDAGCKKLSQAISKMNEGLRTLPANEMNPQTSTGDEAAQTESAGFTDQVPEDCLDLLVKFGNSQTAVLEDFEAYVLDLDKENQSARDAIRRTLHTWKGEFGVLSLRSYSQMVHRLEDALDADQVRSDDLLKLKDFLSDRFARFTEKSVISVSENDYRLLLSGTRNKDLELQNKTTDQAFEASAATSPTISTAAVSQVAPSDPSLVNDFIAESRDHLHAAETQLLNLETDPTNHENINTIFRAWHTIKGVAGFLNLTNIQALAHSTENIMDTVRKGERILTPRCIDLLLQANDCLKAFMAALEQAAPGECFLSPDNFSQIMDKLKNSPEPGLLPASSKKVGEILVDEKQVSPQQVRQAVAQQQAGDNRKIGEILIEDQKVPAHAVADALARQNAGRVVHGIEETIRVPVNRIGQLVDTIGEAVIAHSMIYADKAIKEIDDQALHTKMEHAAMIMRSIQEMAMSLRMVSIKSTFQKMARLARDLSKKFGRDLEFVTEGEDTELDKSVVENIGDPLIHMIRNSIDHGIESAQERLAAGKNAKATVKLRAYHRAGQIFIEVSDDGKGLDKQAILAKAVTRGLCRENQSLTEQEIYQFIFLPGFSTARQVTDVSGRGVGMDVVRRNVEALRGSIEIFSAQGKGTTFTIRLPLTLAIVDGMIIRAGTNNYIVPTLAIIESLRPNADQVDTVMHRGSMVKVRGELIPLVHLASVFHKNGTIWNAREGVVMIVEDMLGKKIGLHIDEIVGQQQVVVKNLGAGMHEVPGVTGGAIMSDGTVSLILDIGGIVKMATEI